MQFHTSILGLALAVTASAALKNPSLNATVEHGVNTECKTCPYNLCTNKATYESDEGVTLTCWTTGDSVDRGGPQSDDIWLKTKDNCYVADYDLKDEGRDYSELLAYCGRASSVKKIIQTSAKTEYDTECQVCPAIGCDNVEYIKYGEDLNVTCKTDIGQSILGDRTWLKTAQNCYVSQTGLVAKANRTLPDCGPIPFLQYNQTTKGEPSSSYNSTDSFIPMNSTAKSNSSISTTTMFSTVTQTSTATEISTTPEPTTDPTASSNALQREAVPTTISRARGTIQKRYLTNFTVADTEAVCRSCRSTDATKCTTIKEYAKNRGVTAQCYETVDEGNVGDKGMWLFTTDFCWVREADFVSPGLRSNYRFPECKLFR